MKYVLVLIAALSFTLAAEAKKKDRDDCSPIHACHGEIWIKTNGQWELAEIGKSVPIPAGEQLCLGAFSFSTGVVFADGVRAILSVANNSFLPAIAQEKNGEAGDKSYNHMLVVYDQKKRELGRAFAASSAHYIGGSFYASDDRSYQVFCR